MANNKEMPVGVKIIAVLDYIGAALGVIFGLLFLFGAGAVGSMMPYFGALGGAMFAVAGVFMIGLGVLAFFVGRGLWRGQAWARIVSIILAVLGVISALFSIFGNNVGGGIFNLLLNGIIGGYLWFSKEAKAAFA
jgi:hypothetical protein